MKKIFLFLILFLFPLVVFAKDTCDSNDIKIQSIKLEKSTGNIEEVSEANISNQKINLGLKMNVLGDAAEYKIVLKNNSNEDYYFDEESLNLDMESVNYEVLFDDNTNLIRGGEEKTVTLKVSYREKLDSSLYNDGVYSGSQVVQLNMSNIVNPFTGRFLGLFIFICLVVGFFVLYKDKRKLSCFLLLFSFLIPFTVNAVCKHSLEVNANLVVDVKDTVFLPGREVNVKLKQLAGDNATSYSFNDTLITSIQYSSVEPVDSNKEEKNIVSIPDSGYPIYMWFDNGTIYWWSEDKTPALNENSSYMLSYMNKLEDISGVDSFDVSKAIDLTGFFYMDDIRTTDYLIKWNVSNTKLLVAFLMYNDKLTSIDGIKNWDVRNVEDMAVLFRGCMSLEEIDLSNWDTKSLTSLFGMFAMTNKSGVITVNDTLKRIVLSEKFDTSKVDSFITFINGNTGIEDWSFLEYLDTSNAVYFNSLFSSTNIDNLKYVANWNVSKVKSMESIFNQTLLSSLDGLEKWDVSSLENGKWMFSYITTLEDASAINDWDITNVTNFTSMFEGTGVHPNFSKREGTWNRGTFVPTNS